MESILEWKHLGNICVQDVFFSGDINTNRTVNDSTRKPTSTHNTSKDVPKSYTTEFILNPLRRRTIHLIEQLLAEDDIDDRDDHMNPLNSFSTPLFLEKPEFIKSAKNYHLRNISKITDLSMFRDYLLLLLPELDDENGGFVVLNKRLLRRQLVTMMILHSGDVASYLASKYLGFSVSSLYHPKSVQSQKSENQNFEQNSPEVINHTYPLNPKRYNKHLKSNYISKRAAVDNYASTTSVTNSSESSMNLFIYNCEDLLNNQSLFEHQGGIIVSGLNHYLDGTNCGHIDPDQETDSTDRKVPHTKVPISKGLSLEYGGYKLHITKSSNPNSSVFCGFISTRYFKGFDVKVFKCSTHGHKNALKLAQRYFKLRRRRGRPLSKLPLNASNDQVNVPKKNTSTNESNGNQNWRINRSSSIAKGEFYSTRLQKLNARANEFPPIEGIKFEAESFSWIVEYGGEQRRYLVKKHGWEKARIYAINKLQEWKEMKHLEEDYYEPEMDHKKHLTELDDSQHSPKKLKSTTDNPTGYQISDNTDVVPGETTCSQFQEPIADILPDN